jgi:hypothetical protein
MKMNFKFPRVEASEITTEGSSIAECTQAAYDIRVKETTPKKINGDVVE